MSLTQREIFYLLDDVSAAEDGSVTVDPFSRFTHELRDQSDRHAVEGVRRLSAFTPSTPLRRASLDVWVSNYRPSYTTRPSTTVATTSISRIPAGRFHGEAPSTVRSARFPGSIVPRRSSSNPAYAAPLV